MINEYLYFPLISAAPCPTPFPLPPPSPPHHAKQVQTSIAAVQVTWIKNELPSCLACVAGAPSERRAGDLEEETCARG